VSAPHAAAGDAEVFPRRAILVLLLVGLVAFAGFSLLATYAPELRGRSSGGAHALSSSAVGYRGAERLLGALGTRTRIDRIPAKARRRPAAGLVLTPSPNTSADDLAAAGEGLRTLIVLPKWRTLPDPRRPGFVIKGGLLDTREWPGKLLERFGAGTEVQVSTGWRRPVLQGEGGAFAPETLLPMGRLDGLQFIRGPAWLPVLADAEGRVVLAQSRDRPDTYVLADPDLLNNQGLGDLGSARAGMAILQMLSGDEGVVFDVTLNGYVGERSLARLMLEPPWLAATLCVLAAAMLAGWQALARFGAPLVEGRAVGLGAAALVDNSAGLIRMGRKEASLAPAYAADTFALAAAAVGAGVAGGGTAVDLDRLARAAEQRGLASPQALAAAAAAARTRDQLMAVAADFHRWRLEMTRGRD
jgi:hypothetical protein